MEKKASVTFEVTKDKTTVIATGLTGNIDRIDITGSRVGFNRSRKISNECKFMIDAQ
jgi:hypothetical protein